MMLMKNWYAMAIAYSLFFSLYFLWFSYCQSITDNNYLFPLFTIPVALFCINFYYYKKRPLINYAFLFSFYSLPHIIAFFTGTATFLAGRFAGIHTDPNFCAIYLSVALLGSYFTIKEAMNSHIIFKIIHGFNIVMCICLIFLSGSRGAMLSMFAIILFFVFLHKGLKWYFKALLFIIAASSYIVLMQYIESLPFWVSPDDSIIDSILCRFKPEHMEDGSHRSEIWATALSAVFNSDLVFPIGSEKALHSIHREFAHNTYIDLLLENGFLVGLLMDIFILFHLAKIVRLYAINKFNRRDGTFVIITVVILTELFFLSAYRQKIFWLSVFFVICATSKRYIKSQC